MRIPRFLALLSFALFTLCAASFADIPYDFSTKGTGDLLVTTWTFNAGSNAITLWGFTGVGSGTTDLWYKTDGGDETGMGLANDTVDHEIKGNSFLEFTTANVTTITIGSVQPTESWALYGSNSIGTRGTTLLASGTTDVPPPAGGLNIAAIDSGWTYVSLFSPTGNILLDGANAPAPRVPEPGTTAMIMTLGLAGLFEVGRRKLMA
jgi:hypothetical protein